jgi:predicted kinase
MQSPTLIFTIGIPGSGKSTWCLSMKKKGFNIISTDGLRKELTGSVIYNAEQALMISEEAQNRVLGLLESDRQVILDATNLKTSPRRQFIQKVKETIFGVKIFYKLFPLDIGLSRIRIDDDVQNNIERTNVSDEVLHELAALYEETLKSLPEEPMTPFVEGN